MNWNKARKWVGVLLIGAMAAGCGNTAKPAAETKGAPQKLAVGASLYTLAEFARQVGGDRVTVTQFIPQGVEPHDWEPTPKDLAKLQGQKVFLYNGKGLEPWIENAKKASAEKQVAFVEASRGIASLTMIAEEDEHDQKDAAKQESSAKDQTPEMVEDPHVWLDPLLAKQQVNTIKDALIQADPDGKTYYEERAAAYSKELDKLDADYRAMIAKATQKDFVTTHAAFGYMAKRYGLQQLAIMGVSPHAEPTPADMAKLVNEVKEHQIKTIFFETLISPKLAETIAQQTGAKTLVLNPIEGLTPDDVQRNDNYITLMRRNLENMSIALQVKQ